MPFPVPRRSAVVSGWGCALLAVASLWAEPSPPADSPEVSVEESARKLLKAIDTQLVTVTARLEKSNVQANDASLPGTERDQHRAQTLRWERMLKQLSEQRASLLRLFPSLAPPPPPAPDAPGTVPP